MEPVWKSEAEIVLRDEGSACILTGKATDVEVGKNKKLTWKVKNHCSSQQTVVVGNFRTTAPRRQQRLQCGNEGGATSPFQQDDEARRTAEPVLAQDKEPNDDEKIQLKVKTRDVLGGSRLRYYFDICLSTTKVDPRLMIEE